MTRRSRILLALGAVVAGAAAVVLWPARGARVDAPAAELPGAGAAGAVVRPPAREVVIRGRVVDLVQQRPVAGVEVVFRGDRGETTATTGRDGAYTVRLARGSHRAFVRDDSVLSLGRRDVMRLPWQPGAELARVPDEALMAEVIAADDAAGVDLPVVRAGIVTGHIVDPRNRPVAGAVIHALTAGMRPVLATDIAASGADGSFELRLPPGGFELAASHPRFAGLDAPARYLARSDRRLDVTVTLAPGCVITGRVVAPGGRGSDGAIERQSAPGDFGFAPAGSIDADGAFRWTTTDDDDITLRAWPWKSAPSLGRPFHCRDGARFDGVVFEVPELPPDIDGVLVDHAGRPVGFAFLDVRPLDPGGIGQQERTDGAGHWAIYREVPGRYRVLAAADGGVASAVVTTPGTGIRLELGGTGRLEGTTPNLASGSFELVLERCFDGAQALPLPQSRRLVIVAGGRFTVDGVPACPLSFVTVWHGRALPHQVAVPAGGAARLELALGEPRDKTVRGVVRDAAGAPVAGATVSVLRPDDNASADASARSDARGGYTIGASARSDARGDYTIRAFSGAVLRASAGGKFGRGRVGAAAIDAEQVDLVIGDDGDSDGDGS